MQEGIQIDMHGPPGDAASRVRAAFGGLLDAVSELEAASRNKELFGRIRHRVLTEFMDKRSKQQALPTAMALMRSLTAAGGAWPDEPDLLHRMLQVTPARFDAYVTAFLKGPVAMDMLVVGNMDHSAALELADHLAYLFKLEEKALYDNFNSPEAVVSFPSDTEARFRASVPQAALVVQKFIAPKTLRVDSVSRKAANPRANAQPATTQIGEAGAHGQQVGDVQPAQIGTAFGSAFTDTNSRQQQVTVLREPTAKEAAALLILRMVVQFLVPHVALTEPIGVAGGSVLSREGGGPWSVVLYQSGKKSVDRAANVFRSIMPLVIKRINDPELFAMARTLARNSLSTHPASLAEAVERDWHEVRSTRHCYSRRQDYLSALDAVTPAEVRELAVAAHQAPATVVKVFPRSDHTEVILINYGVKKCF